MRPQRGPGQCRMTSDNGMMKSAGQAEPVLSVEKASLKSLYAWGTERLQETGIAEAQLDAWYLLEHVTGISRAMYYIMPEKALTEEQQQQYEVYIEKRAARVPLQHLTGTQAFMGLEFQVNEHVLIPRQDTEILVEEALKLLKEKIQGAEDLIKSTGALRVLDLCTGSGCILLSILYYTGGRISGTGSDISHEALKVARKNAAALQIEADWLEGDLFEKAQGRFQMIVSNPPYIPTAVIGTLQEEVREHDPILALDGKADGLYFYRRIAAEAGAYLEKGGVLLLEIGAEQGEDVSGLLRENGYQKIRVKKDLAGLDRVVIGVYDKESEV